MRIVGGEWRGRRLDAGPDRRIRPTSDRLRESLFNILAHGDPPLPEGAVVIDAFAGTGALGFEALSRGARHVTFIDNHRDSRKLIEQNAALLGIAGGMNSDRYDIVSTNLAKLSAPPCKEPANLILMDPPYDKGLVTPTLEGLIAQGALAPGCVVVVELGPKEEISVPDGLSQIREITSKKSRIVILTSR